MQPGRWIATLTGDLCGPGQPGEYRYALHPVDQYPGPGAPGAVYPGLQRSLRGGGRCPHDLHFEKNPNVFAGCVGIAVLLSLGLIQSSKTNWENAYTRSCSSSMPWLSCWPSVWGNRDHRRRFPGPSGAGTEGETGRSSDSHAGNPGTYSGLRCSNLHDLFRGVERRSANSPVVPSGGLRHPVRDGPLARRAAVKSIWKAGESSSWL